MRTLLEITYHSIDWSTQCSIYLSSFFVSVKLVLCAIEVSRSLHSVYSCSSWNFDRMKLGLGTGMPNPKWFHLFVLRVNYFLKSESIMLHKISILFDVWQILKKMTVSHGYLKSTHIFNFYQKGQVHQNQKIFWWKLKIICVDFKYSCDAVLFKKKNCHTHLKESIFYATLYSKPVFDAVKGNP